MPETEEALAQPTAGPKWSPEVVFDAYEAAKAGMSEEGVAAALGVSASTFAAWKKKRAVFAAALAKGKEARRQAAIAVSAPGTRAVWEDALGRLPAGIRKVWREVAYYNAVERNEKRPTGKKIHSLLKRHGDKVTQQLYVHALFKTNFNRAEARKRLNLSAQRVAVWEREDPDFKLLLIAVQEAKKDLFESKLVEAVARGDTAAVLFANRTLNRDRGYTDKQEVEHTHQHSVSFDQLPLDLETKKKVLEAYRRASVPALPAYDARHGVIDAEVVNILEGEE